MQELTNIAIVATNKMTATICFTLGFILTPHLHLLYYIFIFFGIINQKDNII